jgi:hypothetical protein
MDLDSVTAQMARNAQAIQHLVEGIADEQARWRPGKDEWSILEVINHLGDEEVEDFRARLDLILNRPDAPWPGIDPQGWVVRRRYNERDLAQSVHRLRSARDASLEWLGGLPSPDWRAVCQAPFGEITAGDMMASWVAHDLLHMRQLVELHWAYTVRLVQPHRVAYAGAW